MYTIEGKNFKVFTQTISTDWAEIDLPGRVYSLLFKARSTTPVLYLKRHDDDTDYITVPAGDAVYIGVGMDADNHFYLKSDTNPTVVEFLYTE